MIDYVRGAIAELTATNAVIDCGGVGYFCNISLNTYTALQGKAEGKLYVYEAIREDAWVLFGFATKIERELFLMLISVSGVGGNTARTMLSSFSASELADIILNGNERLLTTIKGLGKKTAQRVIVELRDKVDSLGLQGSGSTEAVADAPKNSAVYNDALEALKMLGYPPAPAAKAVRAVLKKEPEATVERAIKLSLQMGI